MAGLMDERNAMLGGAMQGLSDVGQMQMERLNTNRQGEAQAHNLKGQLYGTIAGAAASALAAGIGSMSAPAAQGAGAAKDATQAGSAGTGEGFTLQRTAALGGPGNATSSFAPSYQELNTQSTQMSLPEANKALFSTPSPESAPGGALGRTMAAAGTGPQVTSYQEAMGHLFSTPNQANAPGGAMGSAFGGKAAMAPKGLSGSWWDNLSNW